MSKVPAPAIATMTSLETRFAMTKLILAAIIGACIGGLIGGLAFGTLASDTTATAFLRLKNPADLIAIAGGADQITPDNQGNAATFVAGEIAYLSGEGFSDAVARKMAMDGPAELNVAQASESAVITISYSADSSSDAIRTVQTAIDLYRQDLERRADVQLRTILPTLTRWQQRDSTDPLRREQLAQVRESVELQSVEAATLMVVQPPLPNRPSTAQWVIGVFLGALLGGSVVMAFLLARRRRSGRGSLVKTITDGVDGVLLPAVDLDVPANDDWADDHRRLARTLYAQCPSPGPSRVVLVIGASESSGAPVVASLLEFAAAESQPLADATTPLGQHSSPASETSPSTRVVLGGAVGDSTLSPDVIGSATDIVLVARLDADTVPAALALRSATASSSAPAVAVFTYHRSQRQGLGRRRPSTEAVDSQLVSDGAGGRPTSR
ncbi:hypothetical protein [Mycolicibacterium lacusdiani]|uniref:hypothetical protein n=1 Tax=Mycolicibacterium lacusdiani TaxID=2895283 RepID=UPI001F3EF96D|nr:hypothetical protein [Mycolicibacterium lacusdiani]